MKIKNIINKNDLNNLNALARVGHLSHLSEQGKQRKVELLKQSGKPHPNKIDNLRRYANLRTIGVVAIGILAIYAALSVSSKIISPDTVVKLTNDAPITISNSVNNHNSEYSNLNVLNGPFEENSMQSEASKREIDQLIPDNREYLIVFTNSNRYEGQSKDGIPWGQGKITYADHTVFNTYKGQWENGEPNGEGLLIYKNKDEYYGLIKNGFPHKEGQYTYSARNKDDYKQYKGEFSGLFQVRPHGKGTMIYPTFRTPSATRVDFLKLRA